MKKARLQKVVDHLRKVRIKIAMDKLPQFNMGAWGVLENYGVFKEKKDLKCVYSACAIGHTAHLFKKQGFHLTISPNNNKELIPVFKNFEQWDAVSLFFDIPKKDAEWLFHPSQYEYAIDVEIPLSVVADRIEDYIHGINPNEEI